MAMNKNTVLAWATWIMIIVGLGLIALGAFRYDDVAGWGFASVGVGFFVNKFCALCNSVVVLFCQTSLKIN